LEQIILAQVFRVITAPKEIMALNWGIHAPCGGQESRLNGLHKVSAPFSNKMSQLNFIKTEFILRGTIRVGMAF
jgi:hypothetical protein